MTSKSQVIVLAIADGEMLISRQDTGGFHFTVIKHSNALSFSLSDDETAGVCAALGVEYPPADSPAASTVPPVAG